MFYYNREKLESCCFSQNVSLVVLHGSYARGTATAASDVDIGFMSKSKGGRPDFFDTFSVLADIFGDKCDPVVLNGAESMIAYHVAVNGKPLYEAKPGTFAEFKVSAISRYQDTKKFRVLEKEYLKRITGE